MIITVGSREYAVEEVLPYVTKERTERVVEGYRVWMNSARYHLFLRSRVCAGCGIDGTVFLLEQSGPGDADRAHFNLYARTPNGALVLMTKDHIHPKSKGGRNALDNYQPMCFPCNIAKGATCT
jgi:5-methylcytosine-specific restriction endonuclease McrA